MGRQPRRKIRVRKKRQNRFSMILVVMVLIMITVVVTFKRIEIKEKQESYTKREEQLTQQIEAEEKRAEEIEEYGKYTKTKKYVEEEAKEKLGLVNENEIIFQEDN